MTKRVWTRWLPAVVVPVVVVAGVAFSQTMAGAAVNLPDKTPAEVLTLAGESNVQDLSGTIEQTSELGLPQLDLGTSQSEAGAASALELLTGSHTARVYLDGPSNARVQVIDQLAERDVIVNGSDVWLYSSSDNTATQLTVPAGSTGKPDAAGRATMTPAELADSLLAQIDPSTTVTVGTDAVVAGRSTYELVLTPKTTDTLIGSVSIAVDSETGLPLSVVVQARGQDTPAFTLAFTQLTLATPDAALFNFTPPPGATVEQESLPAWPADGSHSHTSDNPTGVVTSGTGWTTVGEIPAGAIPADISNSPLFAQATKPVEGGRLISTALLNIYVTDDGRVLVGSVPFETLLAAATAQ
ncbi:LolA family protein [Leifsonia sp. A12D58]|uniref:LolA family protein n=1 Tax=Leifsonia sp. A12D58 TaxID=3397674 RepID=UPI0039E0F916